LAWEGVDSFLIPYKILRVVMLKHLDKDHALRNQFAEKNGCESLPY